MSERDFSTRPRRRPADGLDLALLVLGAAGLIVATYLTSTAWTERGRARAFAEEARREVEADEARLRTLEARGGASGAIGVQAQLTADAPPPRVLADLAATLPADVRLESLSLTYGETVGVDMQVAARAPAAYDAFLQRLEGSPAFADVRPGDESRAGELRASVQVTYRPPGAVPRRP